MSIANPYLEENLKQNQSISPEEAKLRRNATYLSVAVASTLILSKFYAYIMTDSVSLLSSLMDSTLDVVASILTLISVRVAVTPADTQHRFGHGKLESLAALGQSFFIGASAIFLVFEATRKFFYPHGVSEPVIGIKVMVLSIVLTLILVGYQSYVIKRTKSVAIQADSLHYKGDLLMNVGVIAALYLSKYTGSLYFDPAFAILVAILLVHSSYKIGTDSIHILMDGELSEDDRETIENIVQSHDQVVSIHDLRTRTSGTHVFIEFHLEIDGAMPLKQAHDVTEEIEMMLYKAFPTSEVMIHQEPAGIDDYRLDDLIEDH
jgi:ferrous-iron efflux pump FieF